MLCAKVKHCEWAWLPVYMLHAKLWVELTHTQNLIFAFSSALLPPFQLLDWQVVEVQIFMHE